MRDAVIVDAVRTPVGRRNGALSGLHPGDLSAHVLGALVARNGVDPVEVDDVVWGCVSQVGDQSGNIGRVGVLSAGWPVSVPGTTVDRRCGSGQQAVHFAAASVVAGHYDMAVAGGVESMTRVPMGSAVGDGRLYPDHVLERFEVDRFNQGIGAEMVAEKWGLVPGAARRVLAAVPRACRTRDRLRRARRSARPVRRRSPARRGCSPRRLLGGTRLPQAGVPARRSHHRR